MSSGGRSIASVSIILLMVASGIVAQSTTATCLPSFQWVQIFNLHLVYFLIQSNIRHSILSMRAPAWWLRFSWAIVTVDVSV